MEPGERLVTVLVTAILTDLAGGVVQVALTALHPDQVDSPTETSPVTTDHPTADHRTDLT